MTEEEIQALFLSYVACDKPSQTTHGVNFLQLAHKTLARVLSMRLDVVKKLAL